MKRHKRVEDPKLKATNPKQFAAASKVPLELWPETATVLGCMGLLEGALKYGRSNYRVAGVRASTYIGALKRHANRWFEGMENDPDSGLPQFAHMLACIAILLDAQAAGVMTDDRQIKGGYHKLIDEMTPHVAKLKVKYAKLKPKHYDRRDNK